MSERPTPETDAVKFRLADSNHFAVHVIHARRLERERDEWAERWADLSRTCIKDICAMERERDEAREEWGKASMDAAQLLSEKTKVMKERDEAREDLEEEKRFHHRTHSELVQTQCRLMDVTQAIIDTLEENRHLADGDDCTLAKLKSVVPEWK